MKARALSGTQCSEQRGFLGTQLTPSTGQKELVVWVGHGRKRVWRLVREGSSGAPSAFLRDPEPRRDGEGGETGRRNSRAPQAQSRGCLGPQGGTLQADSCPRGAVACRGAFCMPPEPAFLPLYLEAPAMPGPQWSFRSLQGTLWLEPEGWSLARPEQRPESGQPRPSPEPSTHRASPRSPGQARVQGSVSSFSRVCHSQPKKCPNSRKLISRAEPEENLAIEHSRMTHLI